MYVEGFSHIRNVGACATYARPSAWLAFAVLGFMHAMASAATIEGVVVDGDTGLPLADVTMSAASNPCFGPFGCSFTVEGTAVTATDGVYVIPDLPPGEYMVFAAASDRIVAFHPDGRCFNPDISQCRYEVTELVVLVDDDQSVSGVDFALYPEGIVEGTVTEAESGQPIADTYVTLFGADDRYRRVQTDTDGTYRFGQLREGPFAVQVKDGATKPTRLAVDYPAHACDGFRVRCGLGLNPGERGHPRFGGTWNGRGTGRRGTGTSKIRCFSDAPF